MSRVSHVLPCIDAKTKQLQLLVALSPHMLSRTSHGLWEWDKFDGTTSNRTPVSSAIVIDRPSFLLRLATMTGRSLSPPRPFGPPTSKHRHRQVPCRLLIDSCQLSNVSCHPFLSLLSHYHITLSRLLPARIISFYQLEQYATMPTPTETWQDRRGMFQRGKDVHQPGRKLSNQFGDPLAGRRTSIGSTGSVGLEKTDSIEEPGAQRRRVSCAHLRC